MGRIHYATSGVLAAAVEQVEGDAWADLQQSLPDALRVELGVSVLRLYGGVLLIASHSSALAINRTVGLGFGHPLTSAELDGVIAAYRAAGTSRFLLQWSPAAQPGNAHDMFGQRGFLVVSHIAKMVRSTKERIPPPHRDTALTVREVGPADAQVFERIVAHPLGVPPGLEAGIRSTMGHARWRYYLAFDADRAVAGAALYVNGQHAWCGLGATLESARSRGAQSALLRRRIHDATTSGCQWISADTLVGTVPGSLQSRRNLERIGFTTLYERPNYLVDLTQHTLTSPPAIQ